MKPRIKICGITNVQDAQTAIALGADAIGLVFYAQSPRAVSLATAQDIVRNVPAFVSITALFVNEHPDTIHHILQSLPIDLIQFHGDEDAAFCQQFNRPYLKAVRVRLPEDIPQAFAAFPSARAILFDAYSPNAYGGTGHSFNWTWLAQIQNPPQAWILSGGLNPDNIATAIAQTNATAVDVSSGVEASAGIKSHDKIAAFIHNAQQAT